MIVQLTDSNFENEVTNYDGITLIDFYADWCGPCKIMSPMIDKLAEENLEGIKVCKLNVDEAPNTASDFGIMSIPTILIIKNKEVVKSFVGVTEIEKIKEELLSL